MDGMCIHTWATHELDMMSMGNVGSNILHDKYYVFTCLTIFVGFGEHHINAEFTYVNNIYCTDSGIYFFEFLTDVLFASKLKFQCDICHLEKEVTNNDGAPNKPHNPQPYIMLKNLSDGKLKFDLSKLFCI